jgi:hypothetical protein
MLELARTAENHSATQWGSGIFEAASLIEYESKLIPTVIGYDTSAH